MHHNELIRKCIEGKAAKDVIRSIEEDHPDASTVRNEMLRHLRMVGISFVNKDVVVEGTCIKLTTTSKLSESDRGILMHVVDTYASNYPEVDIVLASSK